VRSLGALNFAIGVSAYGVLEDKVDGKGLIVHTQTEFKKIGPAGEWLVNKLKSSDVGLNPRIAEEVGKKFQGFLRGTDEAFKGRG
jgi:hypothetical protein